MVYSLTMGSKKKPTKTTTKKKVISAAAAKREVAASVTGRSRTAATPKKVGPKAKAFREKAARIGTSMAKQELAMSKRGMKKK